MRPLTHCSRLDLFPSLPLRITSSIDNLDTLASHTNETSTLSNKTTNTLFIMQTTFLLATLASSALASHVLNAAPAFKRDLQAIAPRQTDGAGVGGLTEECQSAALDLLQTLPTPAPKIQSDIIANPQTGDPCSFSTPSSLSKEYASYSSELMSWYSDKEKDISSAISACSDLASLGGDMLNVCSTEVPEGLAGSEATKTSDESSSETSTEESSNETSGSSSGNDNTSASNEEASETSTGGAARETGMAVAAIAAVVAAVL
jgi:hypothetical protein